jgi:hypothetical protein
MDTDKVKASRAPNVVELRAWLRARVEDERRPFEDRLADLGRLSRLAATRNGYDMKGGVR